MRGDCNAGVGFGGGVVAVRCVYGWYTCFRCLASAGDVLLEMSVVRGVGGVCDMCLARGGV